MVSPQDIHTMCNVHLAAVLPALGIKLWNGKFYWRDHSGRTFETTEKRKILVTYEVAA